MRSFTRQITQQPVRIGVRGSLLAVLAAGLFGALSAAPQVARACGGCFTPPPPIMQSESVITDEKMILSISMSQTTLYDQIEYSGSPASFAWVLPIKGDVQVGLSADILFQTMDQLTATTITAPPANCPPPPTCSGGSGGGCFGGASNSASFEAFPNGAAAGGSTVTVTSQAQVGPYETVQLHSNDGSALNQWLAQHGYEIPASTKPIIDAYVSQHFDFLALKLVPGAGVQAMQPVRVTSRGAAPSLPLHMVAVGTGATTGITIWVVADGRWQPSNFPTFMIDDSDIAWDWATSSSNYESVRKSKEAKYGGRGWQIESSLELSEYTFGQTLQQNIDDDPTGSVGGYTPTSATVADAGSRPEASPTDSGKRDVGPADASGVANDAASLTEAGEAASGANFEASVDAAPSFDAGTASTGEGTAAAEITAADADLAVLFYGIALPNARITRLRSDVAKSALTVDMILQASSDQSELTNEHTPTKEIGEPLCYLYDQNCVATVQVPRSQAQAAASGGGCSTSRPRQGSGASVAIGFTLAGLLGLRHQRARRKRERDSR